MTQSRYPADGQQVADHELARLRRLCDDLAGLEETVATYVGRAADKLRGQGSLAGGVMLLDLTDADRGNPAIMRVMDRVNAYWGRGTLSLVHTPPPDVALRRHALCGAAVCGVTSDQLDVYQFIASYIENRVHMDAQRE